jgi:hypothetical protein
MLLHTVHVLPAIRMLRKLLNGKYHPFSISAVLYPETLYNSFHGDGPYQLVL